MGLGILVLGLLVFLGTHVFVSFRGVRADVIARVGLPVYRALFALVSLAGLVLIVWGYAQYRAHDWIPVWSPPAFMRHITVGLDAVRGDLRRRGIYPEPHQGTLKHPMLAERQDLGAGASAVERRPRLDPAVRIVPGLGASYARIAAKRRGDLGSAVAPAGWTNDVDRRGGRHRRLISRSAMSSIRS